MYQSSGHVDHLKNIQSIELLNKTTLRTKMSSHLKNRLITLIRSPKILWIFITHTKNHKLKMSRKAKCLKVSDEL